jgi:(p)ppGpp synthase/HD superfamily hydrolase
MQLTTRFNEAMLYAAELHAGQVRKVGGESYLSHLLAVASLVLEYGGNEDEAIAALLHDAIEDQGGAETDEVIRKRFGDNVAAIVEGCTDADISPKPPWQERKEAFLARLEHGSASIRLVVAADKFHNARSLTRDYRQYGDAIWSHFKGGREKTLWYYRAVVEVLQRSGTIPLIEELDRAVGELESISGRSPTNLRSVPARG